MKGKKIIIGCIIAFFVLFFIAWFSGQTASRERKVEAEHIVAEKAEKSFSEIEAAYSDNGFIKEIAEYRGTFSENVEYVTISELRTDLYDVEKYLADSDRILLAEQYMEAIEAMYTNVEAEISAAEEAERQAQLIEDYSVIQITDFYTEANPYASWSIDLYINWYNTSEKTIKYVHFTVVPYNAVGDQVMNTAPYNSEAHLECTGPYEYGEGSGSNRYWYQVWANSSIDHPVMKKIEIEYMDGTSVTIPEDYLYLVM